MSQTIKMVIDGNPVEVSSDFTILQACIENGVEIPTLCYIEDMPGDGACRVCVVEVEGAPRLMPSCSTPVTEGMVVYTDSPKVIESRRIVLDLLLSEHDGDCFSCKKVAQCKLREYCVEYGLETSSFGTISKKLPIDKTNPFFDFDRNKCILCRQCERICNLRQCVEVYSVSERGIRTFIGPAFGDSMEESACVSCGNCVSHCPTGALSPKTSASYFDAKKVLTTCSYCGVGCQMYLMVRKNKIIGVEPANGKSNKGMLCVKGKFAYEFVGHKDRLKTPLIKKDGKFVKADWEEAYSLIVEKINETKQKYGADALAGFSSARVTNEENYVFQKFFRAAIGTNNVDHCARLCHSSTVAGLATTLGSGAMTNTVEEIEQEDVVFIIGSNTTEAHPVIGAKIRQAKRNGTKLIVAEPREIDLAKEAEIFLQIRPGTNIALLNGMLNAIVEEGLEDKAFIKERCENFDETIAALKEYTPEKAAEICGIQAEKLRKAARMYATAKKAGIFYSMGITQFSTGTQGVMAVSNLALAVGNLGKEGCGVNPLRGQNNVQGACDMGSLPGDFPGYQKVANPTVLEKFKKAWGKDDLSGQPGLTVTEVIPQCGQKIKMLYIMGENPMISDPDINHVKAGLQKLDFLVVQDIFLTETAELADVVLPAASFAEKDGTFTNTERRIQRVRKAVEPIGQAKVDWEIISELSKRIGYENKFSSASEIMDEIASLTPSYGGVDFNRLEAMDGLQWPCPTKEHPGTRFLHSSQFTREGGKATFKPTIFSEPKERPDADYPFTLTTGRVLFQYHTRTMSGKSEGLNKIAGSSYIEISGTDAKRLGIEDQEEVKVSSRRGEITAKAHVVANKVAPGVVFIPFHFVDGAANTLTNPVFDETAKIPEFKACACKVERIKA